MTLAHALAAARDAALAVGDLLRDDYHGARDDGATKRAEVAAETAIKERLLAACPTWGFRGEETGSRPPTDGAVHWWLVDPLDGTSDHESGARGGAVSIAAVAAGLPVLGVVYAFAAPDDGGDLFTWAEGCPLTRNGRDIEPPPLPDRLRREDVVLLSWKAQGKPDTNLALIKPARFRAVPGIAYRLALIAGGEGDGCASTNGACEWDFAGGHALLRGAGGELVDEHGSPVRYGGDGRAHPVAVFGGHLDLAKQLAKADWSRVFEGRGEKWAALPVRGESIADAGVLSRAQGCLLGQVAGDSLGGLVEFKGPADIARRYPGGVRNLVDGGVWSILAGQPTDDSELALSLARSLAAKGRYDDEHVAQAYVRWAASGPFDIGGTTSQALFAGQHGVAAGRAAETARAAASQGSKANGSMMRISPLAVFGHRLPADTLAGLARHDSAITHPNTVCRDACAIFCVAIAHAVRTGDSPQGVYEAALAWARENAVHEVIDWLEAAADNGPADFMDHQGFVKHAFQNAFHQVLHAPSLEEGLVRTVMGGGDTDTNGAIAGALLGAVHGREAVPLQWRRMVTSCHAGPSTSKPRPSAYWPADVMVLAERLLALGARAVHDVPPQTAVTS